MAVIMITHDLGVVAEVADRVDRHVRRARWSSPALSTQLFYDPQHPYTWGLLGSLTRIDRPRTARLAQIVGQPPSLISLPEGCHFRTRCPARVRQVHADAGLHAAGRRSRPPRPLLARRRSRSSRLRMVSTGEIGLEAPQREPAA